MKKGIGLIITFILGFISFLSVLAAVAALHDISHGEPDVSGEWTVVSVSFVLIIAFHLSFAIFVVVPLINSDKIELRKPEKKQ